MLKHRINRNDVKNDAVNLNVSDIKIADIIDAEDLLSSTKIVICTYDDNIDMRNINEIVGVNKYTLLINNVENESGYASMPSDYKNSTLVDSYSIKNGVNTVTGVFSFSIPFFHGFTVENIVYNKYNLETPCAYVTFTAPHYYTAIKPNASDGEVDKTLYLWKYITDSFYNVYYAMGTETDFKEYEDIIFEKMCKIDIVTNDTFKFEIKDKIKVSDFFLMESVDETNSFNAYIPTLRFFRPNFLFSEWGSSSFFFYDYKCKINIPLSSKQQSNLNSEGILSEYIEDARQRSINKTVDMEKDIYYPVIIKNDGMYEDVHKLKFNFHFIRRDNENWTSEAANLWNGIEVDETQTLKLSNDYFVYSDKPENQSDLLTYLSFSNNDVRYQKSKLKKSFIRLSFYDSPNMGGQNLLAYSTIFINGGEYFNKYVRYLEEKGYKAMKYDVKTATEEQQWNEVSITATDDDLIGIRVDREYKEENEDKRLSSQITVTDKYNSDASSEGFYLYLWRDILPVINDLGEKGAQTVYMKVEFNHAGYGRVIPFMMPYWDNKKWNGENGRSEKIGIKTFQEIVDDWNNTGDGQYGAKQYSKFSYIKIKIGYDENQKKYIYYLDNEVYGLPEFSNNELIFNLYESKMV